MLPKRTGQWKQLMVVELIGSGGQIILIEYFSRVVSWGETFGFTP